jgi:hypothetical protein
MSASVVDVTWLWPTRGAETTLVEMWRSCHIWFLVVVEKVKERETSWVEDERK